MNNARDEVPRVSVDSVEDWKRIKSTYMDAVLSQLEDDGVPPDSPIIKYMQRYIEQVLTSAQPNLRVNGRNFESLIDQHDEPDIEQFDEALDRRVWALADNRLAWHKEIANKRRTIPQEVQRSLQGLFEQERAEERFLERQDDILDQNIEDESDDQRDPMPDFHKTSAWAEQLAQSIPNQTERSERFETVAEDIRKLHR
ncbi:hypothetical protein K435DRAFT_959728 [Dendrothele bispora CBS 962.96]|uniref:Uncharacterized protein n=1 Tax=Dendrothele bispora (strain CBS 962.96) TaxID=1314807 RepID=A0A4S8MX56_DENBC|nr:hypothetical protein K435DRAFT_959728 [Dendrothele bispora CBS 962.96]